MNLSLNEVVGTQPVVIDNGSGYIKAGFAGVDLPKVTFPTLVGRLKHQRAMAGALEQDVFIGNKAVNYRGLLRLRYPMTHGVILDWSDMEAIWYHIFAELKINSEEHPVLLTECDLNPDKTRQKTAEIFFESFNSPALFISPQTILALYAAGKTTGVVLDVGDGVSHAVSVYEGFALSNAIVRSDIAGRDVTENLWLQLRRAGYTFHTSAEFDIVRQIKEATCYLLFQPQKNLPHTFGKPANASTNYKLPDGTNITIDKERFLAPEILFNPILIGSEYLGVHDLLFSSINRTDIDLRSTLFEQIVLSGGSTFFPGFGDRLLNELHKLAPKDTKIRISAPSNRKTLTWSGGSILASLSTFKKMWTTKQMYDEEGVSVLQRNWF